MVLRICPVFAAEAKSFIAKTMRMPRVMEGL